MINASSVCIVLNNGIIGRVKKLNLYTTDTNPDHTKWGIEFHQINPDNVEERKIIKALCSMYLAVEPVPTLMLELDPPSLSEQPYGVEIGAVCE